jgi:hypothetical protein
LTLERTVVSHCRGQGIGLLPGGDATLRDVLVADTRTDPSTGLGRSQAILGVAARISMERVHVLRSPTIGILVSDLGGTLEARDLVVRDVLGSEEDGLFGMGVVSQFAARVTLERVRVEDVRTAGLVSLHTGELTATDAVVRNVPAARCGETTCPDLAGGFGTVANWGGTLRLSRFLVDGADLCGVLVGEPEFEGTPSGTDLDTGIVTGVPIGACVQAEGFDSARLAPGVEYREVGIPLQATRYSVPEPPR